MGVIGGAGGYATISPTQGNPIGEAMQNVENSAFRYNAQRIADERTRQEEAQSIREAQDRTLKENLEFDEKHRISATGIQPLDVKIQGAALKLKRVYVEGQNEYKNAKTIEEQNAAYAKMSNAMSTIDQMKQFPDSFNANMNELIKNSDNYDEHSVQENALEGDKFNNGQYVVDIDGNGNLKFSTFDIDKTTGKVSAVKDKDLTPQQMLDKFRGKARINYNGEYKGDSLLDDFAKKIKLTETKDGKGNIVKEDSKGEEKARAFADSLANDENGIYKVRKLLGNPNATKEDVWNKAYSDAMNLVPKKEVKRDYEEAGYQLSLKKEANDQRNSDRTFNKEKAGSTTVVEEQATHKVTGKPLFDANGNPIMTKRVSVTTPTYSEKTQPAKAKKEISRKDIASKAKASGYSVKEYEALLIKNGVTIK